MTTIERHGYMIGYLKKQAADKVEQALAQRNPVEAGAKGFGDVKTMAQAWGRSLKDITTNLWQAYTRKAPTTRPPVGKAPVERPVRPRAERMAANERFDDAEHEHMPA